MKTSTAETTLKRNAPAKTPKPDAPDARLAEPARETSLGKAMRLLFAVAESSDTAGVGVSELIKATGLSRPTIYRFLSELQDLGLVYANQRMRVWQLGPKTVALASSAGNWTMLRRRARQAMESFVDEIGHTVHLGIRDGLDVVYIDKAESRKHLQIASSVGQRRPLNCTALGKCLVAFDANVDLVETVARHLARRTPASITGVRAWRQEIAEVRAAGIAFDMEECSTGARCVAAPITDGEGFAMAAISLSMLTVQSDEAELRRLGEKLRALAARIPGTRDGDPSH